MLGVQRKTIYQWSHRGEGPPKYKVGGRLRFKLSEVEAWLDRHSKAGAHLDTDTQGVPGSTESVADAAEATGPAESVAPDPSPVGSERSDLGNICVAMLAGTLAEMSARLASDGCGRAAAFVADLADRADAYVAGVPS